MESTAFKGIVGYADQLRIEQLVAQNIMTVQGTSQTQEENVILITADNPCCGYH